MENENVIVEELIENVIMLDAEIFSSEWENFLEEPASYLPQNKPPISMALPIPDRNETLLIYHDDGYHYNKQTLSTLKKYVQDEKFLDYDCLSKALKRLNCFGSRLCPMISSTTCLFPFGSSTQHAAWINPIEIEEIKTTDSGTQIKMRGGITYCTRIGKRTIENHAMNALLLLATYRQDRLHKELDGQIPLDYLYLPNTPFMRSICQKPLLQKFPLPLEALEQSYDSERFMKNVLNVSKVIHSGVLSYDAFSKLLK